MCGQLSNNEHIRTIRLCVSMTAAKHTVYVSGAYSMSASAIAKVRPIIYFSPLWMMCPLQVRFLTHTPVHSFERLKILGWFPPRLKAVCQEIAAVWGNVHRCFWILESTVNEIKHKGGTIILELFSIWGIYSRCCYMQPTSFGTITL